MSPERFKMPMPEPREDGGEPAESGVRAKHVGPIDDAEGEPLSPPPSDHPGPPANENSAALGEALRSGTLRFENNLRGLSVEDIYGRRAEDGEDIIPEPETEENHERIQAERERERTAQIAATEDVQTYQDSLFETFEAMDDLLLKKYPKLPPHDMKAMLRAELPDDAELREARARLQAALNAFVGRVAFYRKQKISMPKLDDEVIDLVTVG